MKKIKFMFIFFIILINIINILPAQDLSMTPA